MRDTRGITSIALVVTIIILLILAAITINLAIGEKGIFNTSQKAVENYQNASEKELLDLANLEQETQNEINKNSNETTITQPVKFNTITVEHYGDYVNYPVEIGRGPEEIAKIHKTDWRIFYNDGTYVYLISSYYLLNSKMPEGTGMSSYEGQPYTTYWKEEPINYREMISSVGKNQYKMTWNKISNNIKAVSTLLNTDLWKKFAYNRANGNTRDYAEDAVGAATLEMWVESWNAKGNTKLYCNRSDSIGYYIGTSSSPTTKSLHGLNASDNLYFPTTSWNHLTGGYYCLASPSAYGFDNIMAIYFDGSVGDSNYKNEYLSIRPLVRLKADVLVQMDSNGVWQLQ